MSNSNTFPFDHLINSSAGFKRWIVRCNEDADIELIRCSSSGVEQETVLTIDGSTGEIDLALNQTTPYRLVAANGALTWTTADANGHIDLAGSSDSATKAATVVTTGFIEGQTLSFHLLARSSTGSYTIAASGLTITLDAAGDGCKLVFNGTEWRIAALTGTATAA